MAEKIKLNHPWLVAVWPGMGHVALNAGYYLLAKLGMHVIAEFEVANLFDVDHDSASRPSAQSVLSVDGPQREARHRRLPRRGAITDWQIPILPHADRVLPATRNRTCFYLRRQKQATLTGSIAIISRVLAALISLAHDLLRLSLTKVSADSGGHEGVSSRMTNLPSELRPRRNFNEKDLRSWDCCSLAVSAGPITSAEPDHR
jgi:hypothetical protein